MRVTCRTWRYSGGRSSSVLADLTDAAEAAPGVVVSAIARSRVSVNVIGVLGGGGTCDMLARERVLLTGCDEFLHMQLHQHTTFPQFIAFVSPSLPQLFENVYTYYRTLSSNCKKNVP